ncbi:MAG: autotransporter outer membrane beta-barrel domain-containing protein [Verrucomicrobiota bacterium]
MSIAVTATSTDLTVSGAGGVWDDLWYEGGAGSAIQAFLFESSGTGVVPANTLVTGSGLATFPDPYAAMFATYAPGTVLVIIPNVLHFIIGVGPVAVAPATGTGTGRRRVQTVLFIDTAAMNSLTNSGLPMGLALRDVSRGAADTALRNLNDRLGRATATDLSQGNEVSTGRSSSLLRYLTFMSGENTSYKVALGLADPEERTIEVNMVDTLSAQAGTNFNGQTMGGGLPYAMMGVPLMPMAGGAATVHIVEAAPSGKTVIDDSKAVIETEPWKRWEIFAAGDFSNYAQNQLSNMMQGFNTTSYAGSVGLEYRAKQWLNLGLAWSYLQSDTDVAGNLGNIDLEGNLISTYATVFWKQNWVDLLYSYGSFNSDINRNTGLGSSSRGDTESQSHNIRMNIGHNIQVGKNIIHGPIAGLRYSNGDVDPYSESGGGNANLDYNGTGFESMISRIGWQASHIRPTGWGRLVTQMHLAWEHEYTPENGTVGAALQTSPFAAVTGGSVRRFGGFSDESNGAYPGTDWLSAGAGLRFELDKGFALRTSYEGVFFRSSVAQHYASAKVSYEW